MRAGVSGGRLVAVRAVEQGVADAVGRAGRATQVQADRQARSATKPAAMRTVVASYSAPAAIAVIAPRTVASAAVRKTVMRRRSV